MPLPTLHDPAGSELGSCIPQRCLVAYRMLQQALTGFTPVSSLSLSSLTMFTEVRLPISTVNAGVRASSLCTCMWPWCWCTVGQVESSVAASVRTGGRRCAVRMCTLRCAASSGTIPGPCCWSGPVRTLLCNYPWLLYVCVTRRKQHQPGITPNDSTTHVPTAGSSAALTKPNHTPTQHPRAKRKTIL